MSPRFRSLRGTTLSDYSGSLPGVTQFAQEIDGGASFAASRRSGLDTVPEPVYTEGDPTAHRFAGTARPRDACHARPAGRRIWSRATAIPRSHLPAPCNHCRRAPGALRRHDYRTVRNKEHSRDMEEMTMVPTAANRSAEPPMNGPTDEVRALDGSQQSPGDRQISAGTVWHG